jgi:hypothetical protein
MVDQNNLDKYKEIKFVLQNLSASVSSDKSKILEIEDTFNRIEKQMERFARIQDVKVIEKYLSFVDPEAVE